MTELNLVFLVESPQAKGNPLFQTNLIVNFANGESKTYLDIHPDQPMFIEKGMLTLETLDGSMIWYIPAVSIIDYYTECVRVS
jgi:hypothetical protein